MYVCICNALNDKKVKQALHHGATTPGSVFRHFECQVQCGKCVPTMREMAQEHCSSRCVACPSQIVLPQPALAQTAFEPANGDALPYGVAAE
jgi:bacterioferritin-associated ferredoxin